jgi:hypothetical protein
VHLIKPRVALHATRRVSNSLRSTAEMADRIVLPDGARADARLGILIIAVLGEIFQGGLFFGWNALAIMIKDLGNYSDGCPTQSSSSAGE